MQISCRKICIDYSFFLYLTKCLLRLTLNLTIMKKFIFTFTLITIAFLANVSAQIKVNSSGYVGVGCDPNDLAATFRIYEAATSPRFILQGAHSRLELGVAVSNGWFATCAQLGDVVYRPLGTKHGLIFSLPNNTGNGNSYIKFADDANGGWFSIYNNKRVVIDGNLGIGRTPSYLLDVNGTIRVNSTLYSSDERLKTEIKPLSNEKDKLYLLQGKSYKKTPPPTGITDVRYNEDGEELPSVKREIIETSEYGYLAQELKEVFPDLVDQDSEGYYSINYIGLIPVIVEALKDKRLEIEKQQEQTDKQQAQIDKQQSQIDEQREQIKQLIKLMDIKFINEKVFEENKIESIPLLLQNTPNPFNETTEIGYYIPETVRSANIYIYDVNGFQQKSISIIERGKSATTLQASALRAGIYFYTLICDGKPVDTKQMILTR